MRELEIKSFAMPNAPSALGVELSGFLDANTVEFFNQDIKRTITEKTNKVVIVLKDLQYISSAGIGALMTLANWLRARDIQMTLAQPTEKILKVFNLTGASKLLPLRESLEEALD